MKISTAKSFLEVCEAVVDIYNPFTKQKTTKVDITFASSTNNNRTGSKTVQSVKLHSSETSPVDKSMIYVESKIGMFETIVEETVKENYKKNNYRNE
ncbi:MAG: hypothetical protein ACK52I_07670 [Pseudomonadota bacterium]|jgi:hypothetical protein